MRIAVIGCGAIAERFHLPAMVRMGMVSEAILVDLDLDRAKRLAAQFGARSAKRSLDRVEAEVDMAIVASPHSTHHPLTIELLELGIPVLCEKPLALNEDEVIEIRDRSRELDIPVGVNQTRRFNPAFCAIQEAIESGLIGAVREIRIEEGGEFDWPLETPSMFGARSGGKGVVLDIGIHSLDLVAWWSPQPLQITTALDDAMGGAEATARIRMEGILNDDQNAAVLAGVDLSWLARQKNRALIEGTEGRIEVDIYSLDEWMLTNSGGTSRTMRANTRVKPPGGLADLVLGDFVRAVEEGGQPRVTPEDIRPAIRLVEDFYAVRSQLPMPWEPLAGGWEHE